MKVEGFLILLWGWERKSLKNVVLYPGLPSRFPSRDSLVDSEQNPGILLQVQKEPGQLVCGSESQSGENKGRNLQLVNESLDFCLAALKIQVMAFPGGPVVKNL